MQGKDQTPQEEAEVQSAERLANVGNQKFIFIRNKAKKVLKTQEKLGGNF